MYIGLINPFSRPNFGKTLHTEYHLRWNLKNGKYEYSLFKIVTSKPFQGSHGSFLVKLYLTVTQKEPVVIETSLIVIHVCIVYFRFFFFFYAILTSYWLHGDYELDGGVRYGISSRGMARMLGGGRGYMVGLARGGKG